MHECYSLENCIYVAWSRLCRLQGSLDGAPKDGLFLGFVHFLLTSATVFGGRSGLAVGQEIPHRIVNGAIAADRFEVSQQRFCEVLETMKGQTGITYRSKVGLADPLKARNDIDAMSGGTFGQSRAVRTTSGRRRRSGFTLKPATLTSQGRFRRPLGPLGISRRLPLGGVLPPRCGLVL